MNTIVALLAGLAGGALRLGLPLLLTGLLVWLLRRLDAHWQAEARATHLQTRYAFATTHIVPCWLVRQCPPQTREKCQAFARRDTPCWQVFRDQRGQLKPACLDCAVFKDAPVPANY